MKRFDCLVFQQDSLDLILPKAGYVIARNAAVARNIFDTSFSKPSR